MHYIPIVLVTLVAVEHVYILLLEMFLWDKPRTRKVFGVKQDEVQTLKNLAANQGLYNGFLAAGLIWGLLHPDLVFGQQIHVFFLLCVITAAVYGGFTVKKTIWAVQGIPALAAILAVLVI